MAIYLFPGAFLACSLYFLCWYFPAKHKRDVRVKVRILQKMHEHRVADQWELAKLMGVDVGFVHRLLDGVQEIDAVAASGLVAAFPKTTVEYWYELGHF